MKDDKGLYYYPFPQNRKVRMYIRQVSGEICFRLWNSDDAGLWEKHGWVPWSAITQASDMYSKSSGGFDPGRAYDIHAARTLIQEQADKN